MFKKVKSSDDLLRKGTSSVTAGSLPHSGIHLPAPAPIQISWEQCEETYQHKIQVGKVAALRHCPVPPGITGSNSASRTYIKARDHIVAHLSDFLWQVPNIFFTVSLQMCLLIRDCYRADTLLPLMEQVLILSPIHTLPDSHLEALQWHSRCVFSCFTSLSSSVL